MKNFKDVWEDAAANSVAGGGVSLPADAVKPKRKKSVYDGRTKEGRKLVIVLLTPLLEWMVMALSALDAGTEKQLGNVLELILHGLDLTVPGDRRMLLHFARCGDHFPNELIIGLVLIQAVFELP